MFQPEPTTTIEKLLHEAKVAGSYDLNTIEKAYDLALQVHQNQQRKSGEPLITHLLTTAAYCVRIKLDTDSVVAALLHEVLVIQPDLLNKVDKDFGTDVAFIIDGIKDVKKTTAAFTEYNEDPAGFRNLILKSSEDIRILIIRLSSKIHDAITISNLEPTKQRNAAKKMELMYAPLCEYLGLGSFLQILENTAFAVLYPTQHDFLVNAVATILGKNQELFNSLISEITTELNKYGIEDFSVSFRTKNLFSAYRKMLRKYILPGEQINREHVNQIKDLLGIRIIVNTVPECYMVLGAIHGKYEYDQDEFDDYIIKPKASGYKSVHTVIQYLDSFFEIQIRTKEMHEFNEFGPASHIAYKLAHEKGMRKSDMNWTKNLSEWKQEDASSGLNSESKNKYKISAFANSIFVFTPKGKVIQLNKNSTPLDFAYMIHSDLGNGYQGALVNNKMRAMNYKLDTGDIVQIIKTKKQNVTADWIKNCQMSSTKSKIRKYLRDKESSAAN